MFKSIILYGLWMMLQIPKQPWQERRSPPLAGMGYHLDHMQRRSYRSSTEEAEDTNHVIWRNENNGLTLPTLGLMRPGLESVIISKVGMVISVSTEMLSIELGNGLKNC